MAGQTSKTSKTPATPAKEAPKEAAKAPAFDLASLATSDNAMHEVTAFGTNSAKSAEPSPFKPHVKQSYDQKKAFGFVVPKDNEKEMTNALRRAAYQLGLGIGFDNAPAKDADGNLIDGMVDVRFKAKDKTEHKRRTDAEKAAVLDWAKLNGRAVHVSNVKVLPDGKIEGRIPSNVLAAYDKAMEEEAKK